MAGTTITIRTDGSIRVEGDFQILDQDGKPFGLGGRNKIGLCRCGYSENKPFCDGAHKRVNFQSPIQAFDLPPAAPAPSVASTAAPSAPAETPANPKP